MSETETLNKRKFINTKEALIEDILYYRGIIEENAKTDARHSAAYYQALYRLYDEFIGKIKDMILFKELEPYWEYSHGISYEGASLHLMHMHSYGVDEHGCEICAPDQEFTLFTLSAKYLTVEEYAKLYGTNVGTVRQWIRRAKIRTARKYGNEWRISELTELPRRGYTTGWYMWDKPLSYLPEEFSFLQDYYSIIIEQDEDKSRFHIHLKKQPDSCPSEYEKTITASDREKLEMYLIGNPEIRAILDFGESPLVDIFASGQQHNGEET